MSAAPVLTEDFEDGNWNAFSGADLAGDHSARIVTARSRAGSRAVRFDLLKNDPPLRGGTRAELVADEEAPRQERWYGFSIFLPADGEENFVPDRAAEIVAQWHNIPDQHLGESWTSPPLALLTRDGRWLVNRWWDWDAVTSNDKMWDEDKHETIDLGPYQRGVWTDWAFHVRWGWLAGHAPLLEIYRNGVLVHSGTGPNTTNDQRGVYFKMGLYKWAWSQGQVSDTVRRVIYHDEVRFADAAGSLQAVSPPTAVASTCPSVAAGQWRSVAFAKSRNAVFTSSAVLTPGSLGAAAALGLAPSNATGWNAMAATVLFSDPASEPDHPANSILVRDGAQYRADQTLVYQAGRRYHVRMVVDTAARRYSVYVTPEGGQTVALATRYAFRNGHEGTGTLTHWVLGGAQGGLSACGLQNNGGEVACASTPAGGWRNVSLGAAQSSPFTAMVSVTQDQLGAATAVGLSPASATTWDGMSATVLFSDPSSEPDQPPNSILVRDYDHYRADRVLAYEPGRRYYLRFVVDPARRRYSVFVTPENGQEVPLASDYRFRRYHETVTALTHLTFAAANSALHACAWNVEPATPPASHVQYGYLPPVQYVGGGSTTYAVPAGKIHQTAWDQGGGADIEGVYTAPWNGWESMVWRWADTMRSNAITRVSPAPGTSYPAYRFELTPQDHASPGTEGDHPRAEFFSVDPAEDRRQRTPPSSNVIRQGDEYWATMAFLLPADFPVNHRWATLLQRKFQNGLNNPSPWFTLNVHKGVLDMTLPRGDGNYQFLANLADVKGRWTQITLHEIASSGTDGLFEVYLNGARVARKTGPTLDPGDINYNFHLGYYRANEAASGYTQGPGLGVVYETPLLIRRGANPGGIDAVPTLP